MDAMDLIRRRYSCRAYRALPVPRETLAQLVDAARLAPSGRAEQPWEFVVVTQRETLADLGRLANNGPFIATAQACIAVLCRREAKYAIEDGAAATENILLAATGFGLGSCWVAGDKKHYAGDVEKLLGVPATHKLISLVPIGVPAEAGVATRPKRPLAELLHWERF